MTREEKIKNIISATEAAIKTEEENGTMTDEKRACIINNMNKVICLING